MILKQKNQVDLIHSTIDPSGRLLINEEVEQTDYNRTEQNEPLALQLDANVLNVMRKMVNFASEQVNATFDDMPALEDIPETKYTPPKPLKIDLQDLLTNDVTDETLTEIKNIKDKIKQETSEILTEVENDQKDILEDIFKEQDFDDNDFVNQNIPEIRSDQNKIDLDVRAKVTTTLVPMEVDIKSEDPINILANPNVTNIILPIKQEPYTEISDENDYNQDTIDDNDDDIDFEIWREDDLSLILQEFDKNKIILTDDGYVLLTEPDKMQVEYKPLEQISNEVVALPPEEEMNLDRTHNIILKRKNPNNELANIKKIKNETDLRVRDVVKHPIQRKLEKNIKKYKKNS